MGNRISNISAIDGEPPEDVSNFKYLKATLLKDLIYNTEISTRIITSAKAMARLEMVWKCSISFQTKSKSKSKSLAYLFFSETWTLLVEPGK